MFGSGKKRRAKHKAEEAAAKAYYKALQGTERLDDNLQKADTRTAVQMRDTGLDVDGYTQALGYKADKIAGQYNEKLPELEQGIDAYNKRYDQMRLQMRGQTVNDGYKVVEPRMPNQESGMLAVAYNTPKSQQFFNQNDAQSYADELHQKNIEKASAPVQIGIGNAGMGAQTGGMASVMGMQQSNKANIPSPVISETTQGAIAPNRGRLGANMDAYNDLKKLSDGIGEASKTSGLNNLKTEYEGIAERIRSGLKRAQPPIQAKGLLNSELTTSGLKSTQELMDM